MDKKGLYIRTYGCQMNEYDSEKISRLLEDEYIRVDSINDASLVIVNTCSVREKPEHKLYSLLGELRELKESRPEMLIGVGGCVAQQEGESITKRNEAVDFVFGTHNLSLVPSLVQLRKKGGHPQIAVDYRDEWEELPAGFVNDGKVTRFISISRGCNKNCTYCIVPTTRGKEVSRDPKEIEREVRLAVRAGAKEITLLGQTVNSYGLDLTPKIKFTELLSRLSTVEELKRIRFTSPHPQEIREDFIELFRDNPKICRHVHMPLQSGSDRILKLMNRNYRQKRYIEIIESLRSVDPEVAITTDVIVGFPGETEEDFLETMHVLNAVEFDASFSFVFSPRPGTGAAGMTDPVPNEEKLERLYRLQARQQEITDTRLSKWVGREVEILIEGEVPQSEQDLQGRISQNIVVTLSGAGAVYRPGDFVKCEIIAASRLTLRGKPLEGLNQGKEGSLDRSVGSSYNQKDIVNSPSE